MEKKTVKKSKSYKVSSASVENATTSTESISIPSVFQVGELEPIVNVVNKSSNPLPEYAHESDSGFDLRADLTNIKDYMKYWDGCDYDEERKCVIMFSGGRCLIPTELYTAIPEGYEVQIRSRSGLALKNGVFCLNSPGTIDAGYRSSWGIILFNTSGEPFEIFQGDRIAQGVLQKTYKLHWREVESLDETDRGQGGFGSSGIK